MENKFSGKIKSRRGIIGITYALFDPVLLLLTWLAYRKQTLVPIVLGCILSCILSFLFPDREKMVWSFADKAVTRLYNSIFGDVTLFGPLQMFLGIFLIKQVARMVIVLVTGPFIAPYALGKAIADRLGME